MSLSFAIQTLNAIHFLPSRHLGYTLVSTASRVVTNRERVIEMEWHRNRRTGQENELHRGFIEVLLVI